MIMVMARERWSDVLPRAEEHVGAKNFDWKSSIIRVFFQDKSILIIWSLEFSILFLSSIVDSTLLAGNGLSLVWQL